MHQRVVNEPREDFDSTFCRGCQRARLRCFNLQSRCNRIPEPIDLLDGRFHKLPAKGHFRQRGGRSHKAEKRLIAGETIDEEQFIATDLIDQGSGTRLDDESSIGETAADITIRNGFHECCGSRHFINHRDRSTAIIAVDGDMMGNQKSSRTACKH